MRLYEPSEHSTVPWPKNEDGQYAKSYLEPLMKHGSSLFIANVNAQTYALQWEDKVLPITTADPFAGNCYVCSPYEHYTTYALAELDNIQNRVERASLYLFLKVLALILKFCDIDRVVYINNWYLSTNLYPAINREELAAILDLVKKRFPNRVIMMRSLNPYTNQSLINDALELGFELIPARQIFVTDSHKPTYKKKRDFKSDARLLAKTEYEVLEHNEIHTKHLPRILELYNLLYLDKYTELNPQFTIKLLEQAISNKVLNLRALVKDGTIDAVLGYFKRDGVMTTPLFGYDTKKPPKTGLYRMISNLLVNASEQEEAVLNQSSGAGKFKKTRGCDKYIEYSLCYTSHAGLRARSGWKLLKLIGSKLLEPKLLNNDF